VEIIMGFVSSQVNKVGEMSGSRGQNCRRKRTSLR
jgi:hypothetical protein